MAWVLDYTGRCPKPQTINSYLAAAGLPLKRAKMAGDALVAFVNSYIEIHDSIHPLDTGYLDEEEEQLTIPPWVMERLTEFIETVWKRFGIIMEGRPSLKDLRSLARYLCKYCNFAAY